MTVLSDRAYRALQQSPTIQEQRAEVMAIATRLLHRAQQHGDIRADIAIGDVLIMLTVLSRPTPVAGGDLGEMAFRRMSALMLDGIRTGPASTLPGRPLGDDDVKHLNRRGRFADLDDRPEETVPPHPPSGPSSPGPTVA